MTPSITACPPTSVSSPRPLVFSAYVSPSTMAQLTGTDDPEFDLLYLRAVVDPLDLEHVERAPDVLRRALLTSVRDHAQAELAAFGEHSGELLRRMPAKTGERDTMSEFYSVRRLPYIVRAAYAGFQQTSVTLEEASANLGATPFRTLRRITLPLVMANLVAGTILTFAFAMLEVSDSLILAMREQYFPITKMIYALMGRVEPNAPAVACALGVVGMGILGACLLVAGRILGRRLGQLFRA